jgi:hypothetical protein
VSEEVLPPVNDTTLRAWRKWAHGDPVDGRATLDATAPSTAPARLTTSQPG